MVEHLLLHGFTHVTWIDPYPNRLPSLADLVRLVRAPVQASVSRAEPDGETNHAVEVIMPRALPIEPLPLGACVNRALLWSSVITSLRAAASDGPSVIGVGRPSQLAFWALRHLRHVDSFYDAMDDFPAFYSGLSARSMERIESEIAGAVSHRVCSAPALVSKFASMGLNATCVPNGYTMASLPPPSPQSVRDVVGYVGTIGRWFDWPLVVQMARALPGLRFRLVGPEFVPRPSALPANIEILPECTQAEAVEYITAFRVGLIPFLCTPLTEAVDPIKFYEYRALGVPVWTTPFGTMRSRIGEPGVSHITSDSDWFALAAALESFAESPFQIAAFRRHNDWAARFEALPWLKNDAGAAR